MLIDDAGSTGASSFLVDMNFLFQRFITLRLDGPCESVFT